MKKIKLYLDLKKDYQLQRLKNNISQLDKEKPYLITIEEFKQPRTLNQNSYLWGVVYKVIAQEMGVNINDVHEELKAELGIKEEKPSIITGEISERLKSTSNYDTKEMTNYINSIKVWALGFFGPDFIIPNANDIIAHEIYQNLTNV